jgi:hypothetical protein
MVLAVPVLFLCLQPLSASQDKAPSFDHAQFVVKLLTPISTKGSREGDTFTALVVTPEEYSGAEISGKINKLIKPKKGGGKAEISFQFQSITINGEAWDIQSELKNVSNSQGVKNVDEEGHIISQTSNKKRVAATAVGAGFGALLGGLKGGGKGAAIGAAAGAAAGLIIGIKMTATASDIEFSPGSQFTLDISDLPKDKQNRRMVLPGTP